MHLIFSAASDSFPPDFEQRERCRDGCVQGADATPHPNACDDVARLPDQRPQAFAFRADDKAERHVSIDRKKIPVALAVKARDPDVPFF